MFAAVRSRSQRCPALPKTRAKGGGNGEARQPINYPPTPSRLAAIACLSFTAPAPAHAAAHSQPRRVRVSSPLLPPTRPPLPGATVSAALLVWRVVV
ncbi:hypothetical protein BD410DRAFT_591084 [Rickenella mellea]|uniref:Uncharacterized protein n=1 Tax=Rickenella mellea TaxID=50990 RepID=A0A4Y7PNX0_9AGAM|nr:hypothetical protein BD410DRAFT_591084 [Rickenella mellea]